MMVQYLAAFHNEKGCGPVAQLFSDDEEGEIRRFVERHDRPGFAVYRCVSPLKEGSTRRSLEDVDQIDKFCVDVDFKDLEEDPETVKSRLLQLPLSPTLVLESGGGLHLVFLLKEPIYTDEPEFAAACALLKQLTRCLSGDPAPAHPAALLREVGTHNSKRGEPVQVRPLWGSGQPVDVSEIEALCDLLPEEGTFTRRAVNGRDYSASAASEGPVDVDELLAGAVPGDVNERTLRATGHLIRTGSSVEEAASTVLEALRRVLPGGSESDWDRRRIEIEGQCYRLIRKEPELYDRLPDTLRERWARYLAAGQTPYLLWGRSRGWSVVLKQWSGREQPATLHGSSGTGAGSAPDSNGPASSKPGKVAIEALPFQRFDPSKLPAREWLYGGHYQRGIITATVGPGGSGKSSADLVELIAMCTGRNLLGEQPLERCRAWYHNAEDGTDEIYRRIAAVCQHYKIDQAELEGWLFVTSGITMPIRIAVARTGRAVIEAATAAAIIRTVADNEIGVVSFDPLVATHGATENATGEMDMIIREFARIANATDCAVEIVHHTRKPAPGQEELSVMDSRGAVAIINAVRSARVLNTMSKAEAEKAGVDEVDRRLYFRIDRGKANMAPPGAARWYKFESIDLPNGDSVGVATSWQHPGQGGAASMTEAAARAAEHTFLALLVRFTLEGRNVSASSGASYAPLVFSKEREAKAAKVGRLALVEAMSRLFADKRIRVEETGSSGKRKVRLVIV